MTSHPKKNFETHVLEYLNFTISAHKSHKIIIHISDSSRILWHFLSILTIGYHPMGTNNGFFHWFFLVNFHRQSLSLFSERHGGEGGGIKLWQSVTRRVKNRFPEWYTFCMAPAAMENRISDITFDFQINWGVGQKFSVRNEKI